MASFQLQNSDVLARLKPFGILFEKSLSDLIKGIRSHLKELPESLQKFLDAAILECKNELTTTDLETKAMAVLKLSYLEMYGFDMSWCNFQILEVMSSSKFQQKRIGYLAAIQSFKNEQDLLILATNQFKKDLNSHNPIDIGLALSGIATIVTPNLSKDINDDVVMKLSHSKPYIRKKAILAMYKVFLQYPESLRINFSLVIDKLDDPDVAVVSATINVICEISKKSPHIFINYLPKFFHILGETTNNWLIIRILKLFQSLSRVEPRMKKRILPAIMDLMLKTEASSLTYECVNCIVNGGMLMPDSSKDKDVAKKCIEQLMRFFETRDPNLKFVGLLALISILKIFPVFMHKVDGVSKVIMDCLTDSDLIIKSKALEICHYLVTEDNVVELIKVLLTQLIPSDANTVPEALKLEISSKILTVASKNNYANIPNFKWYVTVLKDVINLTLLPLSPSASSVISTKTSEIIATKVGNEFKSLATKVPSIRPFIISRVIIDSIQDIKVLENCPLLLKDFYWILGEYVDELMASETDDSDDEEEFDAHDNKLLNLGKKIQIFNALINLTIDNDLKLTSGLNFPISKLLIGLPHTDVIVVLIQALVKLFNGIVTDYMLLYAIDGKLAHNKIVELSYYLHKLIIFMSNWENHTHYEVQERALSWLEFLKLCLEAITAEEMLEVEKLRKEEIAHYRDLNKTKAIEDADSSDVIDLSEESDDPDSSDEEEEDGYEGFESTSEDENEEEGEVEQEEDDDVEAVTEELSQHQVADNSVSETIDATPVNKDPELLPYLLSHILPSFFKAYVLNPVAVNAQRKIPIPDDLDLYTVINLSPDFGAFTEDEESDASSTFSSEEDYVSGKEATPLASSNNSREDLKKSERLERLRDDPYYILSSNGAKKTTPRPKLLISKDDTPKSEDHSEGNSIILKGPKKTLKVRKMKKEKVIILSDETIGGPEEDRPAEVPVKQKRKKNLLAIDSSNLDNFDLNSPYMDDGSRDQGDKDFEYNIDLEELRQKLASDATTLEKKKKSKSSKAKGEKENKKKKKAVEHTEEAPSSEPTTVNVERTANSAEPVVLAPKKKKKKAKAVILE